MSLDVRGLVVAARTTRLTVRLVPTAVVISALDLTVRVLSTFLAETDS